MKVWTHWCWLRMAFILAAVGGETRLSPVHAALIVNPAQPISHQVEVQLIQTAHDNGSQPATVFGNSSQRASIEAAVDEIWAQAGIDIHFLPDVVRFNNTYALEGYGTLRPSSHLSSILAEAAIAGGILHPDPHVVNMLLVEIVPGFDFTSQNSVNGIAKLGGNGIAMFVGENLLSFQNGRDVVASVVAHEIGHNLGLKHTTAEIANLMSPSGTTEQLTDSQVEAVFQTTWQNDSVATIPQGGTGFVQELESLDYASDFNGDGTVDGADLIRWRGAFAMSPGGDADGDGDTDGADFLVWQQEFAGSAGATQLIAERSLAVPEPSSLVLILAMLACGSQTCAARMNTNGLRSPRLRAIVLEPSSASQRNSLSPQVGNAL